MRLPDTATPPPADPNPAIRAAWFAFLADWWNGKFDGERKALVFDQTQSVAMPIIGNDSNPFARCSN